MGFSALVRLFCVAFLVVDHDVASYKLSRLQYDSFSPRLLCKTTRELLLSAVEQDYFPTSGIETFISSIAARRMLLPTEYELSFDSYPILKERYLSKNWPERELEESENVDKSILWVDSEQNDKDVERALSNFRKTVLGLEKYRINNPGRVAERYCGMMKCCLRVDNAWGAAANALEYAGLMMRDHVIETDSMEQTSSRPILSVQSLWRQACMRLLDIDTDAFLPSSSSPSPTTSSSSATTSSSSSSTPILPLEGQGGTWDQKYFSQIELSDSGKVAIQDMMLNILRLSVRCLLSRDDVETIDVAVREFDTPGNEFFPPLSSVKMILSLDRAVRLVEEEEGNEQQCVLLNAVHTHTAAATDRSDDVTKEDSVVGDTEAGEYALRALAIAAAQGDWDMDNMERARTDTYVLFTVCDVKSLIEAKPPKGIFDSFMPDSEDDVDD